MERLEEIVYQSIGQASMCWSESPRGTFDEETAKKIAVSLIITIQEHVREQITKERAAWYLSTPHIIRDSDGNEIARSKGGIDGK